MIGQTISHYQVLARLGGGGMGVVYQARDLRLDRLVALKVLPPELTRDAEAKARFMQEAKAASGLDHPNICTVHDIDETPDGQLFLVLAYYPGETLKQTIARGPLALDTALDLATQIAQGLQKAHAAGIVHRDIKPANVMVTPDGVAKIVDFGLAKLVDATGLTRPGTTLGTVAYMAPEQTRGEAVDARSDLWALGVVLYEMVAGRLPFGGDSAGAIAAAIQQQTPTPLTAIRSGVPLDLDHVVARALARDRSERFQTAADLAAELKRLRRASDPEVVARVPATTDTSRAGRSRTTAWALAGVVTAGAVAAALLWPRGTATSSLPRFVNPVQVTNATGVEDYPTWSPDGQTLAYAATETGDTNSGNWHIWVAQVGGGPPVNRTAGDADDYRYPSWSPDGTQIAFWSSREGGGYFVMPALGGAPRKIIDTPATRAAAGRSWAGRPAWSPDGREIAGSVPSLSTHGLTITSLASSRSRRRDLPGGLFGVMDLSWSPSGRFLAFVDASPTAQVTRMYTLRLDNDGTIPLTDGRTSAWSPVWSPDGRALYFVQNGAGTMDLWRQPMTAAGQPDGVPLAVTTGVEMRRAALSRDGRRLAYSKGRRVGNVWRVPIRPDRPATWGDAEQLTFDQAFIEYIDVSPDGTRLLVNSDRSGNSDLWALASAGGEMRQLTVDPTPDWNPRWSPDGQHVAFYAYRSGKREIWVQPAEGGPARQLSRSETGAYWPAWSPDGRRVAFTSVIASGAQRVRLEPVDGGGGHELAINGDAANPEWSPEGRWLTFIAAGSFPEQLWRIPAAGGKPERLGGGRVYFHRWSPDGRRIYMTGVGDRAGAIWEMASDGTRERPVTDLRGRRGYLEPLSLATDGKYLYFTWGEDLSDIWVMDVVRE